MELTENFQVSIHLTLKKLIQEKSKRDNINFTACQLAQALGMPRSIITKLTHADKTKRVTNPRIDTLMKIIDFFRSDGFEVTVEDLLGIEKKTINLKQQQFILNNTTVTIPVYSLNSTKKQLGTVELKIARKHKKAIAFYADKDVNLYFKSGSIFIVNPDITADNDNIVVIKIFDQLLIKKYSLSNTKAILKSLNETEKDILLTPDVQFEIIGVVVHVNAKT